MVSAALPRRVCCPAGGAGYVCAHVWGSSARGEGGWTGGTERRVGGRGWGRGRRRGTVTAAALLLWHRHTRAATPARCPPLAACGNAALTLPALAPPLPLVPRAPHPPIPIPPPSPDCGGAPKPCGGAPKLAHNVGIGMCLGTTVQRTTPPPPPLPPPAPPRAPSAPHNHPFSVFGRVFVIENFLPLAFLVALTIALAYPPPGVFLVNIVVRMGAAWRGWEHSGGTGEGWGGRGGCVL